MGVENDIELRWAQVGASGGDNGADPDLCKGEAGVGPDGVKEKKGKRRCSHYWNRWLMTEEKAAFGFGGCELRALSSGDGRGTVRRARARTVASNGMRRGGGRNGTVGALTGVLTLSAPTPAAGAA
jgi:hypothetical protein